MSRAKNYVEGSCHVWNHAVVEWL